MVELDKTYLGIIEDINDPLKIGRCKVRIGFLFADIPVDHIPWSYPAYNNIFGMNGQCGSISVPKIGSIVKVRFNNGDLYSSVYENLQELADDVKSELNSEYEGTHILLFDGDDDLKIYYTKNKGITMHLKGSRVNIANDETITIEHNDSSSIIELSGPFINITSDSEISSTATNLIIDSSKEVWSKGVKTKLGVSPNYSSVLGEPLFLLLKQLAVMIDAKLYPTPGAAASLVEASKKYTLSNSVTVSQ